MKHSTNLFYLHLNFLGIWWIFHAIIIQSSIQLILSSILMLNQLITLILIKTIHKDKPFFKFTFSILYIIWQTLIIELNIKGESLNIWNYQINTLLIVINQRNLKLFLDGNFKIFVRLFLPIYALIRFFIFLFTVQDFLNFYIIISCVLLIFNNNYNLDKNDQKSNEREKEFNGAQYSGRTDKLSSRRNDHQSIIQSDFKTGQPYLQNSSQVKLTKKQGDYKTDGGLLKIALNNSLKQSLSKINFEKQKSTFNLKEENQMEIMNNFYKNFLDVLPQGILIVNQNQLIIYMNNKIEKFLECKGSQQIIQKLNSLIIQQAKQQL